MQPVIAERLGYTDHAGAVAVERFMKHYYLTAKDVGDLTRIFCAAIEAEHKRRRPWFRLSRLLTEERFGDFKIEADRITVVDDEAFARDPVNIIRMFHEAQARSAMVHPHALRLITQNLHRIDADLRRDPEANRLFLEILTGHRDPAPTLRRMSEARVLGKFVPDFGRVVAQMQFDMYHLYTVDEHTLVCLSVLHAIEAGDLKEVAPIATEVVHKVLSRRALYVAVLLHDIAKGRGGDHSVLGERVARRLCPRLGMSEEETDTVAWLVRWHLIMSNTAFKRDVNDPKTVEDFIQVVQSPERLRLLLVLTVADIRGVGPHVWNGWKAQLLRDLYYRADEALSGDSVRRGTAARIEAAKRRLADALPEWRADEVEEHLALGYPAYWLAFDSATHARHARLVRQAMRDGAHLAVDTRVDGARVGHRGDGVRHRPPGAVLADRRRHGRHRRRRGRRPDLHLVERHGAGRLHDPGRGPTRLRPVRPHRQAGVGDRTRARRHAAGRQGDRGAQAGDRAAHTGAPDPAQGADRQQGERDPHRRRGERP